MRLSLFTNEPIQIGDFVLFDYIHQPLPATDWEVFKVHAYGTTSMQVQDASGIGKYNIGCQGVIRVPPSLIEEVGTYRLAQGKLFSKQKYRLIEATADSFFRVLTGENEKWW